MKKKIIVIVSIIVFLVVAVGCAYLIDKNRMANNKPVIFSTWGYDYTTPVEHENITNKIPNETNDNAELAIIQIKEDETLYIELLSGWTYEISEDSEDRYEYAVNFLAPNTNNKMTLYAYKDRFGVCGTELEIKDITLDIGNTASVGFYDGSERWTFVNFGDDVVMQNGGLTLEESNEALSMIKTIKFIRTLPGHIAVTERSFIATIIEEEPTYLIVEPMDGEIEKLQSNTRKILIADGENRDYIYGVGRKIIITYNNIIQSDTSTIIGATIDVDGYDEFELSVVESENTEKRKILSNKDLDRLNSDYDLCYYGIDEVNIKVAGKEMTLENALKDGYLTLSGILSKANRDITKAEEAYSNYEAHQSVPLILPIKNYYDDGGSVEFRYENFTIIKYHTLDGKSDMYICKAGTTINDLNR